LKPWPKLWQNLRSTRETELADQFPAHVASAWIGNSVAVAVKHYLQVTEDHFKQAAKKATQNPTSKAHESSRNDSKTQMPSKAPGSVSSSDCERLRPNATGRGKSVIMATYLWRSSRERCVLVIATKHSFWR